MTHRIRQQVSRITRVAPLIATVVATVLLLNGCVVARSGPEIKVHEAVQNRVAAGMEYLQLGKPVEARQHLSRAVDLDDNSALAHNAMALLYKYEGDRGREEHHYRKALRADSSYAPARNNYGILLYQKGDYRGAVREFERVANDPGYSGRGPAFENLGRSYLALGERDKAIENFNRALRLVNDPRASLLELAGIYMDEGRPRAASRYHDQYAAVTNPQTAQGLWLGIRIAAANGDYDKQSSYELALRQLYPTSSELEAWRTWRSGPTSGSAG